MSVLQYTCISIYQSHTIVALVNQTMSRAPSGVIAPLQQRAPSQLSPLTSPMYLQHIKRNVIIIIYIMSK